MATLLRAFHNQKTVQDKYVGRVRAHAIADEIAQGAYVSEDDNGKPKYCAVGCALEDPKGNHAAYETEMGIPRILARLEDRIFERLPAKEAKLFPMQFMTAIKLGADLNGVWSKFTQWMLLDKHHGVLQYAKTDEQRAMIQEVADAYAAGITDLAVLRDLRDRAWSVRRSAAYAAADAAYAAAYVAAYVPADAAAYVAAYVAADAAAYVAAAAADAAYVAADAAAYVAYADAAAADAYVAADAAGTKIYQAMRDELLRLLAEAPVNVE